MAARCDICGRGQMYGNRVSHSNRHTKRVFKVNLQHRRLMIDGQMRSVRTCTRCLRTMVKVGKVGKAGLPSA